MTERGARLQSVCYRTEVSPAKVAGSLVRGGENRVLCDEVGTIRGVTCVMALCRMIVCNVRLFHERVASGSSHSGMSRVD